MLELMIRKKMSSKKKEIIHAYGKDMIAEMYLDLLNVTDGKQYDQNQKGPSHTPAVILPNHQMNSTFEVSTHCLPVSYSLWYSLVK